MSIADCISKPEKLIQNDIKTLNVIRSQFHSKKFEKLQDDAENYYHNVIRHHTNNNQIQREARNI